ncbi:hypothetical protein BKA93DRAFT_928802 [Sparassis latifolia]
MRQTDTRTDSLQNLIFDNCQTPLPLFSICLTPTAIMPDDNLTQSLHLSTTDDLLRHQEALLRKSAYFLGNPSLLNHVEWMKKDSMYDVLVVKPRTKGEEPQLADLLCIGEIGAERYFMYPGGYNTATNSDPTRKSQFEKIHGYLRLHSPRKKKLAELWSSTLDGLQKVLSTIPNPRIEKGFDIIQERDNLKIRHDWFEVIQHNESNAAHSRLNVDRPPTESSSDNDNQEFEKTEEQLETEFGIQTWTMCAQSDWATANIERIRNEGKYRGVSLPAFDLHTARAIHSNDCDTLLKGALVNMKLNLTRQRTWDDNRKPADSFFADIAQITVLLPPGYEDKITSSSKRRGMNLPDDVIAAKKKSKK